MTQPPTENKPDFPHDDPLVVPQTERDIAQQTDKHAETTRDPLEVPCLTDKYWITFPERNGLYLARTLTMVEKQSNRLQPLPVYSKMSKDSQLRAEEDNVKTCLNYAREKLDL